MIKAIETQYKGCRFRSRLEARWAVFFDSLGIKWEYEKEGYDLGDGIRYLPDFWIDLWQNGENRYDLPGWGFFIEIKAIAPTDEEREKLFRLARGTGHTVTCFWGKPSIDGWYATIYKGQERGECYFDEGKFNFEFQQFISTNAIYIDLGRGNLHKWHHLPFPYNWALIPDEAKKFRMEKAFIAANSARFEFGG